MDQQQPPDQPELTLEEKEEGDVSASEKEELVAELVAEMTKNVPIHSVTSYGENLLHFACKGNADPSLVKLLIRGGVDILGVSDRSVGLFLFLICWC